jgi:hypothetical protein
MKSESPSIRIALVAFAAILFWLVVSRSLAAYFADSVPTAALWLSPGNANALVNLADSALNVRLVDRPAEKGAGNEDSADPAVGDAADSRGLSDVFETIGQNRSVDLSSISSEVETALRNEPLNAQALRILGQVADVAKDNAKAWKFMHAAARLSLHENMANYWLLRKSTDAADYKAVIYYADVILRAAPGFGTFVMPLLAQATHDQAANNLLKSVLAANPPWRRGFFAMLPNAVADARTPLDLLSSLRTSAVPPASADLDPYLEFLIAHKFYDLAYYAWLQFLPPRELRSVGLLFNGSLEFSPSGLPFDWVIQPGSGVTVDVVPRPDREGQHALLVDFQYGRVDYRSVRQLVLLRPGTYQFAGKYKGELVGPRGMRWRVLCADTGKRVAESPMISGIASAWRDVDFSFTIPSTDCRAQYVLLDLDARMASEQLVSGSMLFDEMRISRSADPRADAARVN